MTSSPDSLEARKELSLADDVKRASVADAKELAEGDTFVIDRKAERALVWKFDSRVLPVLAVMYLFNSLDKSNLGNAKTAGLEKSLGLQGNDYNTILSIFFIPYVLTAPFLGILGKKYGPSRVLPAMMLCFGFTTLMVTVAKNFGGLMTIRWFLGMAESAFFPLVIFCSYYSCFTSTRLMSTRPDNLLPPWRDRTAASHLLCLSEHRFGIWRSSSLRHFPDPYRIARQLAVSVHH